jgi:DNA-binding MarR family transcriptional regulator
VRSKPPSIADGGAPPSDAAGRSLQLDDQLCFALYAASRAITSRYRPLLTELGLTYPQYLVMLVLWDRGSCQVKDLGAVLQLDYGTLSPLLKRLEAAGLVHRDRRSDDERSVQVGLTAAGHALRARAEHIPALIEDAMGLSTKAFVALRATLRQLAASVIAATAGPD